MNYNLQENRKKLFATAIVILFILIFVTQNISFILRDTGAKASDNQIRNAAVYFRHYCLNQKSNIWIPRNFPYPPILYINTFPFFALKGVSMESARLSLVIFSVIFLLSMFGIGKEMGDYYSGIAVMALAASSPHFLNLSRSFYTDMPQIAFTALSFYFLIKSDSFSHRLYTILAGIALALSFLSKWSTAFFILFPLLWLFIPVIIKAKNNINRLISIGVPLTLLGSVLMYYILINPNDTHTKWLACYIPAIIIPTAVWGLLIYFQEKSLDNDQDYRSSCNYSLMNFSLMILMVFTVASPWYLWSGHSIRQKFLQDMQWHRNFYLNFQILLTFIKTAFNFAPILIVTGLVFLFIKKKKLPGNLIFPLSFLAAFFLMMSIGNPQFRYVFTLLIFLAAMGGYWVTYAGKAKIPITCILVGLSLVSMLTWTVIPQNDQFFRSMRFNSDRQDPWITAKLFCSEKPDTAHFNTYPIIEWIFRGTGLVKKPLILVPFFVNEETPIEMEYLYWIGYNSEKDLGPIFVWNMKEQEDGSLYLAIYGDSYEQNFRDQEFGEICIIHRSSVSREKMDRILKIVTDAIGAPPDEPVENIDIGSNVTFTCLRYKQRLKYFSPPEKTTPTIKPELNK